jgi:hypothetical protein
VRESREWRISPKKKAVPLRKQRNCYEAVRQFVFSVYCTITPLMAVLCAPTLLFYLFIASSLCFVAADLLQPPPTDPSLSDTFIGPFADWVNIKTTFGAVGMCIYIFSNFICIKDKY